MRILWHPRLSARWWSIGILLSALVVAELVLTVYPSVAMWRVTQRLAQGPTASHWQEWHNQVVRSAPQHYWQADDLQNLRPPLSTLMVFARWREHESWRFLPAVNYSVQEFRTDVVDFERQELTDEQFLQAKRYVLQPGLTGAEVTSQIKLNLAGSETPIILSGNTRTVIAPQTEIAKTGSQSGKQLEQSLADQLRHDSPDTDVTLQKVSWSPQTMVTKGTLKAGSVTYLQTGCQRQRVGTLMYSPGTQKYTFADLSQIIDTICQSIVDGLLTCDDCWLAPVNKDIALPADYVPNVVATGLPGGRALTPETITALRRLINDAHKKGIEIIIRSGYRSYHDQESTFNAYVKNEMTKGLSRKEAEAKANRYSARPGHSEHQLGTTADLNCSNCKPFGNDGDSRKMYQYLVENGYKYGFVMSYPGGKEYLTGYQYEPWHWRYIGVKLATQVYKQKYLVSGNKAYVNKFLYDLKKY